jgi:hypothetical protein
VIDTPSPPTALPAVQVGLPEVPAGWHAAAAAAAAAGDTPEVLGWEANTEGKLKAR